MGGEISDEIVRIGIEAFYAYGIELDIYPTKKVEGAMREAFIRMRRAYSQADQERLNT